MSAEIETRTRESHPTGTTSLEGNLAAMEVELGDETYTSDGNPMLSTKDLKEIQDDIQNTIRPTWQTGPPANFGSPAHGKLKADQWRTCIEFDLPVSLVKLWDDADQREIPEDLRRRRKKLIESTMHLSTAIRWAVSHRTSEQHAQEYKRHMTAYLKSVRELCPNDDLHPVHHNALHIPDFLRRFGPMHGWWMFPFERLIGILQKVKTNFKMGEAIHFVRNSIELTVPLGQLEKTIMNTFCAASELKVFLQRPGCPEALRECVPILADCFPDLQKGTFNHDIQTLAEENNLQDHRSKKVKLEQDVRDALAKVPGGLESPKEEVRERSRLEIKGRKFAAAHATYRNSIVFFQQSGASELIPGLIRQIIEVGPVDNPRVFLAIHRYLPSIAADPFLKYPGFGAIVRSKQTDDKVEVIPITNRVYGANLRAWRNDEVVVRPLIEASRCFF